MADKDTYEQVERALQAHASAQTDGGLLMHWTLAMAVVSADDPNETHYIYANHDGAPHEWLGLQAMAHRRAMRWEAGEGE